MHHLLFALYIIALCSSAINAAYYGTLPARGRSRRIGALVLALVNFGTALHSTREAVLWLLWQPPSDTAFVVFAVLVQLVIAAGSLAITVLILRRAMVQQPNL